MDDDVALLRRFVERHSDDAFAEFVRRRIDFVYSVALHTTRDTHRAEDAAQIVFTTVARQARLLACHPCLLGWLHRTAHNAASDLLRAERRHAFWQTKAVIMQSAPDPADASVDWERARPLLDAALAELNETDRAAVLLRFFENRPYAEIGGHLRLAENAVRMRVERALDRIQSSLRRRGIASSSAALAAALAGQVNAAAPAGLAASVTSAAITAASVSGGAVTFFALATAQKTSLALLGGTAAVLAFTIAQQQTNTGLRAELAAANANVRQLAAMRAANARLRQQMTDRVATAEQAAELARLRRQIAAQQRPSYRRSEIRIGNRVIPPNTPPAEWLDAMRPGAFSMPTRAWQTLRWLQVSQYREDPDFAELVAATFCLDAAARAEIERFQAALPSDTAARALAPEIIVAAVFADWLWQGDPPARFSPKRSVPHESDPERAYAEVEITYRSGRTSREHFPFYRFGDGWRYGPVTADDATRLLALLDPKTGEPKQR